ncbi:MAG TPA: metal ABC transporter substrate-binding protein [Firmicutes bacterium]|jgi:D-methionine transport system substrate-binding protein|nr:metal ABC transporter substrate-binding protein [Bacillota bacterium]
MKSGGRRTLSAGLCALILLALLAPVAAGGPTAAGAAGPTIILGVTPGVHEELAEIVKPVYEAKGYILKIVVFSDYITPNLALAEGEIDVNSYQHYPFLEQFCIDRKVNLVKIGNSFIFPMGVYSRKVKNLSSLRKGASVAIPNDPSNGGRALVLLESAGLIKLRPGAGWKATVFDVASNPLGIKIVELEAAQLPRALDDVDIACINTNYAMSAGFVPGRDAIVREEADSPWVNILAARAGREKDKALLDLVEAYHSDKVRRHAADKYAGSLFPGF